MDIFLNMSNHNFILNGCDTDSIMFSKKDGDAFSIEEQERLLKELNSLFEEGLSWEHDGVYPKVLYLKAKNYVMWDGKTLKIKGSALKSSKLEPALREFLDSCIKLLVEDAPQEQLVETYNKYIKEAMNVTDIKRWCSKKSITDKIETSERANETKVKDAIAGTEYKQGDKVYLYFKEDESLGLAEHFDGVYNKNRLIEKLYKSTQVFKNIMPVKELFKNYKLKKNKKLLQDLN